MKGYWETLPETRVLFSYLTHTSYNTTATTNTNTLRTIANKTVQLITYNCYINNTSKHTVHCIYVKIQSQRQ